MNPNPKNQQKRNLPPFTSRAKQQKSGEREGSKWGVKRGYRMILGEGESGFSSIKEKGPGTDGNRGKSTGIRIGEVKKTVASRL